MFDSISKYYEIQCDDGSLYVYDLSKVDNIFQFFRAVGAAIAMDDCTGVTVTRIVWDYREYVYAGWRPGMEYTFVAKGKPGKPENEKYAYTVWLPEYDH